jgi:hypothetical protein
MRKLSDIIINEDEATTWKKDLATSLKAIVDDVMKNLDVNKDNAIEYLKNVLGEI